VDAIQENANHPKTMIQSVENVVSIALMQKKPALQILVRTVPYHPTTPLTYPPEIILDSNDHLVWQPELSTQKTQWASWL
jgi:hypothetical protein